MAYDKEYYQAHKKERIAKQKAYNKAHNDERRAYHKVVLYGLEL